MKAWRLERLGGALTLEDVPVPEVRPHSVLVRIEAAPLLSYLKRYVEGKLAFYSPPFKRSGVRLPLAPPVKILTLQ